MTSEPSQPARRHQPATQEQLAADVQLARRVVQGERRAVDLFVERMRCIPRLIEIRSAGNPLPASEVDDLAQEVFAAVWRRLDTYRGDAPLEAWVHVFCVRILGNALRKRARRQGELELEMPEEVPEAKPDRANPRLERLTRALAMLDASSYEIVQLHGAQGMEYDAIAARLSCTARAARARYQRAMAKLRDILDRQETHEQEN